MEIMVQILNIIAPLFIIIFTGVLMQKFMNIDDNWSRVLNDFALKIGFPILIFTALTKASFSIWEKLNLIIIYSFFVLFSFALAYFLWKILNLKKKNFKTFFICLAFGNVAYLGMPTLTQVYGEQILLDASLIVAVSLFWIFTIWIWYLDFSIINDKEILAINIFKNLFKNPLLLSVIFWIIFFSLNIKLPLILTKSFDMIATSVSPLVLIVIGFFIGKSKIWRINEWIPVVLFSILKLLVLPCIFYFFIKYSWYFPREFSSLIIESAMPLAITPFALAEKYDLDKDFITRSIVISTIISVLSLPFWISIL